MSDLHSAALSRTDVPTLVNVLLNREKRGRDTWRIAEVLDLLLDAGQFKLALDLASDITRRIDSAEKQRLFMAYKSFCELMVFGVVGDTLDELQRMYSIIQHGGHSTADKTRASLLLARALVFCVKADVSSEEVVLRARSILLERLSETADAREKCLLYIELAKSYLYSRKPELCAARGVMSELETSAAIFGLSADMQFDAACLEHILNAPVNGVDFALELSFRTQFSDAPPIRRALQELSIQRARPESDVDLEVLQRNAETLESLGFLGGAFEASFLLARILIAKGLNVPALRTAKRALKSAERAGFLYGEVAAKLLLFEIYQLGGVEREREAIAKSLRERYFSELIVLGHGRSIGIIQGSAASSESLVRYARKVDEMSSQGISTSSRMSVLSLAARTYFHAKRWREAQQAWKKLARCERENGLLLESFASELMGARCRLVNALASPIPEPNELEEVEANLVQLSDSFHRFSPTPKAKLGRARSHILLGQLHGARGEALIALKHLSIARDLCEQLGAVTELAAVECATGSFLLQVGGRGDLSILESSVLSLKRADEFYRVIGDGKARLRALYFLASAAKLLSNIQPSRLRSMRWKKLAMSWIVECSAVYRKSNRGSLTQLDCDSFDAAPEITISAIRSLKSSLSSGRRKSLGRDSGNRESDRFAGQFVH